MSERRRCWRCTASAGASSRGRPCSTCCRASTSPCRAGRSPPWSARPAPASRRCCTSPACWSGPSAGEVTIEGAACNGLGDAERTRLRRERIGFVYQFHHLLPDFTALENVAMPQLIAGRRTREAKARARAAAEPARPRRAPRPSPGPAVRRRAAAGRDRPRAGQRAGPDPGRRAHRQSRPAHRRGGVRGPARGGARHRHGRADRHPQSGARGAHGRDLPPQRRPRGAPAAGRLTTDASQEVVDSRPTGLAQCPSLACTLAAHPEPCPMPHADFVHLRVRSAFSLLQSTVRVEPLAAACGAARCRRWRSPTTPTCSARCSSAPPPRRPACSRSSAPCCPWPPPEGRPARRPGRQRRRAARGPGQGCDGLRQSAAAAEPRLGRRRARGGDPRVAPGACRLPAPD